MAEKYKGHENKEAFHADIERRRSNAGQPHLDRRTKRARTRKDALKRHIDRDAA